jgi:hypothetical protein
MDGTINFIRGYVNEQLQVCLSARLQYVVETDEITAKKRFGVGNAPVDVSFRCKIHDIIGVARNLSAGSGI